MSKQTRVDRPTKGLGRRAMLERSAAGSAALAAGLLGFGGATEAGAAQLPTGLQQAVTTGRMRRVVSARDGQGKSFIASDEEVDISELWRTTEDQLLGAGPAGEPAPAFRATGASSFYIATMPKSPDPMPTLQNRIGFHQTRGVGYVLILTGELVYMVDREEVRLKPGDFLVERGTEHSWRNEGDPVTMLVTIVSAEA